MTTPRRAIVPIAIFGLVAAAANVACAPPPTPSLSRPDPGPTTTHPDAPAASSDSPPSPPSGLAAAGGIGLGNVGAPDSGWVEADAAAYQET